HSQSIDSVKTHDDFAAALESSEFKGDRCDLILYALIKDLVTEKEAKDCIVKLIKAGTVREDTTFTKRAITYLAFKDI
ncbi:MAG: hypothetical protein J6Y90_00060, partial [Lachnospiraceae bacterium]|nr:hypothetical protein [Lachnospiraceae bacterium]